MEKDDNLRRAIDVMTAWATGGGDDTTFTGERLANYIGEGADNIGGPDGEMKLMFGLISLAGTVLMRLETATGKSMQWHLQDIARRSLNR